jgi:hypothetical protein
MAAVLDNRSITGLMVSAGVPALFALTSMDASSSIAGVTFRNITTP